MGRIGLVGLLVPGCNHLSCVNCSGSSFGMRLVVGFVQVQTENPRRVFVILLFRFTVNTEKVFG